MIKLAIRNLFHERTRISISVGGVALAVVLILTLAGVFAGSEEHAVAYIKNQPAPLWLMQSGVENLHMSSSILPPEAIRRTRQVEGSSCWSAYASGGVTSRDRLLILRWRMGLLLAVLGFGGRQCRPGA
jgi:hypothetical protein